MSSTAMHDVTEDVAALLSELRQRDIRIQLDGQSLRVRGAKDNLTGDLASRIQRLKGELVVFLRHAAENAEATAARIPRRDSDAPPNLSFMQQNLWLIDRLEGSAHYNMSSALNIEGRLDPVALERALHATVERHESLRTVFREAADGTPRQVLLGTFVFGLNRIDLSDLQGPAQAEAIRHLCNEEAARPFDLAQDLMMRSTLLCLEPERFILLNAMHHIASDGASLDVLLQDICLLYQSFGKGEGNPLAPLPLQYADYSAWLSQWLQTEPQQRKLGYWERQLADLPLRHCLPLDRPRPACRTTRGERHSRLFTRQQYQALSAICSDHDATMFMLMHAAFALFLSRWSGERDIAIATPVSTRDGAELAPLIGYFGNILVLRSDCDDSACFADFLRASRKTILDAHEHRHAPFEELVRRLNPPRSLAYSPLAQVSFMLLGTTPAAFETIELPGVRISPLADFEHVAMKFDLELALIENRDGLRAMWSFNTAIFDRTTIEAMDRYFDSLLQSIAVDPGQRLSQLPQPPPSQSPPRDVGCAGSHDLPNAVDHDDPPSSPIEEMLMALWTQVLQVAPPGVGANFFEHGGRSLLAVQLVSMIRNQTSIDMPLRTVFERPVLRDQAAWLARQQQRNAPLPSQSEQPEPPAEPVQPETGHGSHTERALTAIWAAHLGLAADQIGVADSFFEIGGNSQMSINVQAHIREALGIEVSMADLFQYPTIQHLARLIDGTTRQTTDRAATLKSAKERILRGRARVRRNDGRARSMPPAISRND